MRNGFMRKLRAALQGETTVKPSIASQNTIYARKAREFRGQPEPSPTPSGEFAAVRRDQAVVEFPTVQVD